MVYPGKYMSDDPARDVERCYEAQEVQYAMEDSCATCDCCGRTCGAEDHYDVNGKIACDAECAKKLLSEKELNQIVDEFIDNNLDFIIDEWLEDHTIEAGHEYQMQYGD